MNLDWIKKQRKTQGLSQKELAEKVSITSVHISSIETDKVVPNYKIIERIAKALNVTILFVMKDEQESIDACNLVQALRKAREK